MMTVLKSPWVYIPVLSVIAGGLFIAVVSGERDPNIETERLSRHTVTQVVTETGEVQAADSVTLSFEVSGRVVEIAATEGGSVANGAVLARLDDSGQRSELRGAEARLEELRAGVGEADRTVSAAALRSAEIALENAQENLKETKREHDRLVSNARKTLLSSNIEARLTGGGGESQEWSYDPPTITGTYESDEEGEYRITLFRSGRPSGYSFEYKGIEGGTGGVSTVEPQPLGVRGLLITFPDNFARGALVEWTVSIPNREASGYTANRNVYEGALDSRDIALERAERDLRVAEQAYEEALARHEQTVAPVRSEQIAAQEAAVESAQTALARTRLRSPFAGVVTHIDISRGEFVSAGTPVLDLISDGLFEITVHVPEADIAGLSVGDTATVRLDAYRDDVFEAEVVSVAPRARRVDGISSFKTVLIFTEDDPRIRAGLTGDVDIVIDEVGDVFAVPARAIIAEGGSRFVRILESDGTLRPVEVTVGLRGVDGRVEIDGDLSEGDEIVTFIGR